MFTLEGVVPWGRSFDEYRRMFAITDRDGKGTILGCGDGPASFNAEGTRRGFTIVSCDPLYRLDGAAIRMRIDAAYEQIMEQTRKNVSEFVWTTIPSVEALGEARMRAMMTFLSDYDAGKATRRYLDGELPKLPFDAASFDLAVCSHFLFVYSTKLTSDFIAPRLTSFVASPLKSDSFRSSNSGGGRRLISNLCAHTSSRTASKYRLKPSITRSDEAVTR